MRFAKLTTAIAAGVMAFGISAAKAQDTLRIGVEGAYPPFSEKTSSGELVAVALLATRRPRRNTAILSETAKTSGMR